ncbi:MAG: hypothetical protein HY906_19760 [Deltaproteobacteria bacterium]|nr:hypothetical protein [Deltaproteobacteria bacterium]
MRDVLMVCWFLAALSVSGCSDKAAWDPNGEALRPAGDAATAVDEPGSSLGAPSAVGDEPGSAVLPPGPRLILRPVQLAWSAEWPQPSCSSFSVVEADVFLFRDGALVLATTVRCQDGEVDVGPVDPGQYQLAFFARAYVGSGGPPGRVELYFTTGTCLDTGVYPVEPWDTPCTPPQVDVAADVATVMSLSPYCNEVLSGCRDCCGR